MAQFSSVLLNMLTEFIVCEVGQKAIDGITYAMMFKDTNDKELYDRYMTIKKEAVKCGFSNDEVFRVYEVSNGYIFDMDINAAKQVTLEISKSVAKLNGGQTPVADLIKDMPEQRRKKDMIGLAKYLKQAYDSGKTQVEVALFSRNSTNRIIINGRGPKDEVLALKYNAYAIRHWDMELINEKILIPAGFRVKRMQPCEILPSKTGVSFLLTMESMSDYEKLYE